MAGAPRIAVLSVIGSLIRKLNDISFFPYLPIVIFLSSLIAFSILYIFS